MNILKENKEVKNFYIFLIGQFVSQFGSKMTSYGLVLWAFKQSGSVLSSSILTLCYLVPEVLLSFFAGGLSDSWNKKKIMLISDSIGAIFSVIVLSLLLVGTLEIKYLYFINIILGIIDAFQNPASEATVSIIVSRENYMKTSGIRSFFNSCTSIFAPLVATSLYAFWGLKVVLIVDFMTFCFAFYTLLWCVEIPELPIFKLSEESVFKKCKFGLIYLAKRKDVFSLILFMAFINLIVAIYNTNFVPMVLLRNGNNDVQLGIVSGAIGVAGLFGSILVTKLPNKNVHKRVPLILNIMSFSFLICNSLLGIGRNYYVWTIAVFLGNVFIPLFSANVDYLMRTKIPMELQGRVFSARNTLQYTSIPIGTFVGGVLSDKVFEPFMQDTSVGPRLFSFLVGTGKGSGIALLYIVLAAIGALGCYMFKKNKKMQELDVE